MKIQSKNIIDEKQILDKKEIGKYKGDKVWEISTLGGLYMVIVDNSSEPLAVTAHPALSRFVARKNFKDFECTELSKSEVDFGKFSGMISKYEELTALFRKRAGY